MKIRKIGRSDWKRITKRTFRIEDIEYDGMKGKIAFLKMDEVEEPFSVFENGKQITIVDKDYVWIQTAFENQYFWMTAMFDNEGNFIEVYTDITGGNVVDVDEPYFEDMYLDYVIYDKDHDLKNHIGLDELDMDELIEAYENGTITKAQYDKTLGEGRKVKEYCLAHHDEIIEAFKDKWKNFMATIC